MKVSYIAKLRFFLKLKILNFICNAFSLLSKQFTNYQCVLHITALYPWVWRFLLLHFQPVIIFLNLNCFHFKLCIFKHLLLHGQSFILQTRNVTISIYSAWKHKCHQLELNLLEWSPTLRAWFRVSAQFT